MSSLRNDSNPLSSASSVASTSSSSMDQLQLPPNKYLMKTLCFNKRSVCMPSKDDYSQLLSCGLGARKWQVCLDLDADTFRCALLNIYPRLSTVTGYTLWALTKDKKFEKLPQKVNTPGRIRAYLGSQFTGCLIIMPTEEISLGPSPISNPVTNGVETDVSLKNGFSLVRDKCGRFRPTFDNSPMLQQQATTLRQFCLLCGRMAKQAGGPSSSSAAAFYNICSPISSSSPGEDEEEDGPSRTIASCLRSILRVELPKRRLVPSDDICKRCFRQINEIDYLETQLKNSKDDLIANFLTTISKVGRIESSQAFLPPAAACSINIVASASHSPIHLHPPSPAAPYRAPYMQHPHAEVLGIPQRVFLTPSGSYQRTFDPYSGAVGINYSKERRSSSRAGLDDEDEDNRSERMNELSSSPTSDSSCSSSSQGSHGSHGSQGSQGGQEAAGPPRQPWKKRCREIRSAERDVVMQHAKMARQQLQQQQAPPVLVARGCSNVDSGHGGSDEDSAASMASDKG